MRNTWGEGWNEEAGVLELGKSLGIEWNVVPYFFSFFFFIFSRPQGKSIALCRQHGGEGRWRRTAWRTSLTYALSESVYLIPIFVRTSRLYARGRRMHRSREVRKK
jgi:hypothetical protein